jgi:hypothetical protein
MQKPLIIGSCVSRDIYNYYAESEFKIAEYYARTSLVSLMSPRPSSAFSVALDRIASPFQRRVVGLELSRDLRHKLHLLDFDYILMDLIDERHDILEVEAGVYVTLTQEFRATGYLEDNPLASRHVVACGSTRHKLLWLEALRRFVDLCASNGVKDKIIVNRTFWATELANGQQIPGTSVGYTELHNCLLEWMYHMIEPMLEPRQFLPLPKALLVSTLDHRWGPSPFHYDDAYYNYLKGRVKEHADELAERCSFSPSLIPEHA